MAALGCVFVGYIFNIQGLQTKLDAGFGGLNQSAQGHGQQVATLFINALPVLGVGLIVLFFLAFLRNRSASPKSLAKARAKEVRGIEAFVDTAEENGVSPKVARAAYRLLLPYVRKGKHLQAASTLCGELKVKPEDLSHLYGSLLRHTDRRRRAGEDASQMKTPLDLMKGAEASETKLTGAPGTFVAAMKPNAPLTAPIAQVIEMPAPVLVHAGAPLHAKSSAVRPKPAKPPAVLVHPARLARREMSIIRERAPRAFR